MHFVRESEGIYKYGKKRVFMKIEGDQIIIRVGGGYLTIEEFIDQYCDGEQSKKNFYGLIYGGACSGSKDFKTFYFTQKPKADQKEKHGDKFERDTASEDCDNGEYVDVVEDLKPLKDSQRD